MKAVVYKKTLPMRKTKLCDFKGVSFRFFSKNLPVKYAVRQENLKIENGYLVPSQTPKKIDFELDFVPQEAVNFYGKKQEKILFLGTDKLVSLSCKNGIFEETQVEKVDFKAFCEYKLADKYLIVFATENGLVAYDGEQFENVVKDVNFSVICNHFYRLFATEENSTKLYFSDDFNPFNWNISIDEGGYINLPQEKGTINKLLSFNQSLIVVQEDGLTKITAFSEQDDFVVKSIISPNNIKKDSVVCCGDVMLFVSEKGLCVYNGYDCKNICPEIADFFKGKIVKGVYVAGYCYFLCYEEKKNINDSIIFAYDLQSGLYHFITCGKQKQISSVRFENDDYVLLYGDKFLEYISEKENNKMRVWQSGAVDFGRPCEEKIVKNIEFGGNTIIDLKVTVDGVNYFYNILQNRRQILNLKGKQFEFEIKPKGMNICISPPYIEYQILEVK